MLSFYYRGNSFPRAFKQTPFYILLARTGLCAHFRLILGKGSKLTLPNLDCFILYYQGSSIYYQNRPLVEGRREEELPGGHAQ